MCVLMSTTVDCVCCVGEQDCIAESIVDCMYCQC